MFGATRISRSAFPNILPQSIFIATVSAPIVVFVSYRVKTRSEYSLTDTLQAEKGVEEFVVRLPVIAVVSGEAFGTLVRAVAGATL